MTEPQARTDPRVELGVIELFLTHWRGSLISVALGSVAIMAAWSDYLSWPQRVVWCAVALSALAVQALACLRLERAADRQAALKRWMPWLWITLLIGGCAWGAVPWMLVDTPMSTQLLAVLINVMLLVSIISLPGTGVMILCAWTPVALLTCGALLKHPEQWLIAAALLAMFVATLIYGLRLQRAIATSLWERYRAADLVRTLKGQQQRLIEVERERALLLERERLMGDMHDGLGSVLVSSLAAVERGALTPEEMALALRECVDDLRIVIDSLDPDNNDLVGLLATLRFHLGRRLEMAGIELEWGVEELPPLAWMGASESLQLMRAIQEVLSNIIKHANARRVSVIARESGAGVEVIIRDDGRGFEPSQATNGRGLRSLKQRIGALHGQFTLSSQSGAGTEVRLWLPFDIDVQTGAGANPALETAAVNQQALS